MKIKLIAYSLSAALLVSSCSVIKKSVSGKSDRKVEPVEVIKPEKKKDKKNRHKNKHNTGETLTAAGRMPNEDELYGGEWLISGVKGKTVQAEDDAPYIVFDRKGRFYAGDGCNVLNGDYVLRSDGKIMFNAVLSTMKMCPDNKYGELIAGVLSDGMSYSVDCRTIGQDTYLYLKNGKGVAEVTLRRHNMEFLNGNWRITSAEGKSIDDEEANLFIDIAQLKVHGNTGCNYFNGELYIDPSRSNAIDFSDMGITRMACPKEDQERRILVGLEQAVTAVAGKHEDTVILLDAKGRQTLTLKKIPLTENE